MEQSKVLLTRLRNSSRVEGVMKQYLKPKYIVLGIAIVIFCFVPMINMSYEVVVQKQVEEEYVTVEPYTVQEEVREPYTIYTIDKTSPYPDSGVTKWRTVTKDLNKYREVTKTRLVTRPVVETRTKRVSILRYLLR
ncbi:MAG: hypothetical protein ABIK32_00420 [Chloroflexota bacterium]